ncbi:O-antigen ligase family protein [Cellulophaga baltica 4]|nr:O-antigen ligase family protein [Cellulophaga baltica 4]
MLFSVIYGLFYSFGAENSLGTQYIFIYMITPPVFYLFGKYLIKDKILNQNNIFYIILCVVTVFSLSAVISVFLNFHEGGFAQLDRTIPMFWNGAPVSATIMGGFLTFNMCIPALLISNQGKKGIIFNILLSTLFAITLVCVLRLGSRTQLGIFLITTIISLIYVIPKQSFKRNLLLFVFIGAIIFFITKNISFDLNQDWLTTFADRMDKGGSDIASGGGRTERWEKSFRNLFEKPLGWDVREFGYSHNLWLDVLRVSGFIPFFLLVIFSIKSLIQIRKIVLLKPNNILLNSQIIIYSIAFFLLFMVEPIFEGLFTFFVLFCLFKGSINKYYLNNLN